MLPVALVAAGASVVVASPAAAACTAGSSPDAASASVLAQECGKPVVVSDAMSPTEKLVANGDGSFTDTQWASPAQVRASDGSWVPVDLTLKVNPGGSVSPIASPTGVTLSGGGAGPLAIESAAGRQLVWSWPGYPLPTPKLSGASATYAEVIPGIDLTITVDGLGFSEVLVVKTRVALASPALARLSFALSGSGLSAAGVAGAATSADAAVAAPFAIGDAAMWDSSQPVTPLTGTSAEDVKAASTSTVGGAGVAAKFASVPTRMSGTSLVLVPDAGMLSAADTTLPVFIDPTSKSTNASYWSMINKGHPDQEYWDYDRTEHAKVGNAGDGVNMYRSLFQFSTANWKGKHVTGVTFNDNLVHSWSCSNTTTQLHIVPTTLSKSLTWNTGPAWGTDYADRSSQNCSDASGVVDSWGSTALTAAVDAQHNASTITLGLRAADETISTNGSNGWKKYQESGSTGPRLSVTYNTAPTVATSSLTLDSLPCGSSGSPSIVSTLNGHSPVMHATVTDAESDKSTMTFTYPGGTKAYTLVASGTSMTYGIPTAGIPSGSTVYSWNVSVTDGIDSSTSATCYFKVDNTLPAAPTVTSADGRYPDESVDASPHDGVGKPGTFTIQAPDAVRYEWAFNLSDPTGKNSTVVTAGAAITISVTPTTVGDNSITAIAYNAAGTKSAPGAITFNVAIPDAPVGHWALDGDGTDTGSSPHTATASNVTWTQDARVIGHQVATMNGTSSQLTATSPISTGTSFAVAAWVRLDSMPATDVVAVAQDGVDAAGFHLGVRVISGGVYWSFLMKDTSAQSSATRAAYAPTALTTADLGHWVRLVGVFDASANQVELYVSDVLVATVARGGTPWQAGGPLAIGRGFSSGAPGNWWPGAVSDVQAWDRVVYQSDVDALDPAVLAGRWILDDAPSSGVGTEADALGLHPLSSNTVVGGWDTLNSVPDAMFNGTDSAAVTSSPVLRTDGSYTVSAWAMLTDNSTTYRAVVSEDDAGPASGFKIDTSPTAHVWEWVIPDNNSGTITQSFIATGSITVGDWTHLVGVFDAATNTGTLYINGVSVGTFTTPTHSWTASGALTVGRTRWNGHNSDMWAGEIDNVEAFAGALNAHQVCELYNYGDAFSTNPGC